MSNRLNGYGEDGTPTATKAPASKTEARRDLMVRVDVCRQCLSGPTPTRSSAAQAIVAFGIGAAVGWWMGRR